MVVSVTGHRPDKLEVGGVAPYPNNTYAYDRLVQCLFYGITQLNPEKVISGMALGVDMAAAQACIYADVPYVAAIPFKGQESQWPDSSQVYYKGLLDSAEEVVYVSEGGYSAEKMQTRNEWMVDHADTVLTLWNGSSGGTANCVVYATKQEKPIESLWEVWKTHKEDDFKFSTLRPDTIEYGSLTFPSVENFYQAMKVTDQRLRSVIAGMSPEEAKEYGENIKDVREDWSENMAVDVMRHGLSLRLKDKSQRDALLSTRKSFLVNWSEDDTFWGRRKSDNVGENLLGVLLMGLRYEAYS